MIHEAKGKGTYRLCSKNDSTIVLKSLYNGARLKLYYDRDLSQVKYLILPK